MGKERATKKQLLHLSGNGFLDVAETESVVWEFEVLRLVCAST